MTGKSKDDEEILAKAEELSKLGASERKVEMAKYDKKQEKQQKQEKKRGAAGSIDSMLKKQQKTSE